MDNTRLIRIHNPNASPFERIREVTSQPVGYLAPTIKSILDERDIVPKTRGRIFNPGRSFNGGVVLILPSAHFRWQEPVTNGKEYCEFLNATLERYTLEYAEIYKYGEETGDWDEALRRGVTLTKEMILPANHMGRLYDGITELPIIPTNYNDLSNGQRLYWVGINYGPYSKIKRHSDLRKSVMEYYQDHSNTSTSDKATKPSLADIVRRMVPQLEPTG